MITVELPWPHRDLSPNSRRHWRNRWSRGKAHKGFAFTLTQDAARGRAVKPHAKLVIGLTFVPPANRRYDIDNLVARMKYPLDGIADALKVNDRQFSFGSIALVQAVKPGKVIVTISEAA